MRKFIYITLTVVGIALTVWAVQYAYADRGYFAVGSEYLFLLLPLFGLVVDCMMQDHIDEVRYREME